MPPPNPIASLYGIPVKKGAEAQLAKVAEAEARGKKRTAADDELGASRGPKPILSLPVSSQAVQRRRGRDELKRARRKVATAGGSAQGGGSGQGGGGAAPSAARAVVREGRETESPDGKHYLDDKGRSRPVKTITVDDKGHTAQVFGGSGYNRWPEEVRGVAIEFCRQKYPVAMRQWPERDEGTDPKVPRTINMTEIVRELQETEPRLFAGKEEGQKALYRQVLKQWLLRWYMGQRRALEEGTEEAAAIADNRGRPPALPKELDDKIGITCEAFMKTKALRFSRHLLVPVALGVLEAMGRMDLLSDKGGKGNFKCGPDYISGLAHRRGWKFVAPSGDARKLPTDADALVEKMVLRIMNDKAFYEIINACIANADQTGMYHNQQKGTTIAIPGESKEVQNMNDKAQFTFTPPNTLAGDMMPGQAIFAGSSMRSLPKFEKVKHSDLYRITSGSWHGGKWLSGVIEEKSSKGGISQTGCYVLTEEGANDSDELKAARASLSHIGSFCHTSSHWSTVETSKAIVRDIMVPFFKARGAGEGVGAAQKRALLLVDVWWGWKDKGFRKWIKETYPWLLLRFVPPCCTPIGQPSDLGLMAKIKAGTRKGYNEWVMGQVRAHLKAGKAPEELNIKLGANMKTLISQWLGPACDVSKEEVQHYWYKVKDMELVAKSDPELRQRALAMRHEEKQETAAEMTVVDADPEPEQQQGFGDIVATSTFQPRSRRERRVPPRLRTEDNSDVCAKCHNGGNLVCCDNCPAAWHVECIPGEQRTAAQLPSNWSCPACATAAATPAA